MIDAARGGRIIHYPPPAASRAGDGIRRLRGQQGRTERLHQAARHRMGQAPHHGQRRGAGLRTDGIFVQDAASNERFMQMMIGRIPFGRFGDSARS